LSFRRKPKSFIAKPLNINVLALLIPRSTAQTVVADLNIVFKNRGVTGRRRRYANVKITLPNPFFFIEIDDICSKKLNFPMIDSDKKHFVFFDFWASLTLCVGLTLIVLVPPFHSPDEFNHFYKSYHIADQHFTPEFDKSKKHLGGFIPRSLVTVSKPFEKLVLRAKLKTSQDTIVKYLHYPLVPEDKLFVSFPNTARYALTAYLPQALTIMATMPYKITPIRMLYFGRFMTFMFWFVLILQALRWTPVPFRQALMVMTLLPASLAINTTLNADVITNGLIFMQLGLFLQLKVHYKKLSQPQIYTKLFLFMALVLMGTLHKAVYFPMLFLLILLEKDIFNNSLFKKYGFITFNLALNVGLILLWANHIQQYIYPFGDITRTTYSDLRPGFNVNPDLQMQYVVNHLIAFLKKFIIATFTTYSNNYTGYIASFGWENVQLPSGLGYFFITFLMIWMAVQPIVWTRFERFFLLGVAQAMTALFLFSMHLHWDSVGEELIDYYNAKYYFPMYALILLAWSGSLAHFRDVLYEKVYFHTLLKLFFMIISVDFLILVYERYYNV
jgi:uncharacterized membrane protein